MSPVRSRHAVCGSAARCLGRLSSLLLLLLAVLLADAASALADPLLVDETPGLYQRILTRPRAQIVAHVGEPAGTTPDTFSAYYVFARKTVDGTQWLQVGANRLGAPGGWIRADQTVAWNQAMVLAFGEPTGRLPVLFFKDRDALLRVVEDERLPVLAPQLVKQARSGTLPPDSGVISIEPEEWVDLRSHFYLLPILGATDEFLPSGARGKIAEIASIPLSEEPAAPADAAAAYRVGVMFVVDTTTSMKRYIDRTRQAIEHIFERLRASPVGERISFGMVAFRDALMPAPGLEYLTKVVAPLKVPPDHDAFEAALGKLKVSHVPSAGFNEDGLAGMVEAIGRDEWKDFGGRFIIFLSDAGVREADDPFSSTRLSPARVNELARDKTIAVISMLLATPMGEAYHAVAERQLKQMSFWTGMSRPAFYRVPEGDISAFGPTLDQVVDAMVGQIESGATAASGGTERDRAAEASDCAAAGEGAAHLVAAIRCAGHAMRLAWLGRERGVEAPSVFNGWAPDFALNDPSRKAFDVRVLLTKEQLSNLSTALQAVLEAGREALDHDPATFFAQLRSVVARAATDPGSVDPARIDSLGDLLDAYLAHLPYESQLMELNETTWLDFGPARQDEILATVKSKIRAYQYFHDDASRWIRLNADASDDELVYPIPLGLLP
ncbi:serine/threonine-protein kinase PpkA [Tistlia consotensis]|uniref:Serine/threonine-protein kinase PpkA n=1 Tax=Tistlia consotensis USBA 355 TaxID=560819 RepID=A0A1Y6CJG7_9PROT|nr:vWA domain-containing protein [Tistlia consotensis]SMF66188.1 serine/threonine-protein kinase PpkA [Tistlia consotensis USBA 355]SNS02595.1 serine/threonine-protein kinase PpkA [Tistlia consotensis]